MNCVPPLLLLLSLCYGRCGVVQRLFTTSQTPHDTTVTQHILLLHKNGSPETIKVKPYMRDCQENHRAFSRCGLPKGGGWWRGCTPAGAARVSPCGTRRGYGRARAADGWPVAHESGSRAGAWALARRYTSSAARLGVGGVVELAWAAGRRRKGLAAKERPPL